MTRERMDDTRSSVTHKASIRTPDGRVKFFITVGFYPDGRPGELFLHMDQSGSTLDGFADAWATAVSLCLQMRTPMRVLVDKFAFQSFDPQGMTDNPDIPVARSVIDYTIRWLEGYLVNRGKVKKGKKA
jgi:ribonucleoside-diphosphate reductase alpha chain